MFLRQAVCAARGDPHEAHPLPLCGRTGAHEDGLQQCAARLSERGTVRLVPNCPSGGTQCGIMFAGLSCQVCGPIRSGSVALQGAGGAGRDPPQGGPTTHPRGPAEIPCDGQDPCAGQRRGLPRQAQDDLPGGGAAARGHQCCSPESVWWKLRRSASWAREAEMTIACNMEHSIIVRIDTYDWYSVDKAKAFPL